MNKNQNTPDRFSVWNYKPWWCQPWSIILTGITIVTGSWLLIHSLWLSILCSLAIATWWFYFLILYPRMAQELDK